MTAHHRRLLCFAGVAKLFAAMVLLTVSGVLVSWEVIDRTSGMAWISLALAIATGGHALCQLCCFPGRTSGRDDGRR